MTRINCHSAFKHYEMFHNNCCGGGSYGSIFNQTVNVNCGGHGGFWSGFGLGLGNAFGNIFGGFLGGGFGNAFGNIFGGFLGGGFGNFGFGGGFGNFGMGGFGFPSFGGFGGGWGNFWGGGAAPATSTTTNTTGVTDKDNALIEDFEKKVKKYEEIATPSDQNKEEAKALYKDIKEKYNKPEDDVYKHQNKLAYKELLDRLEIKFPNIDAAESESDEESEDAGAEQGTAGAGQGAAGAGQGAAGAGQGAAGAGQGAAGAGQGAAGAGQGATGADATVKIGEQEKKIANLNENEIRDLTKDQIKDLKPEQATQLLEKLGIKENEKVKASDLIDRAVIRLLAKACINVKLAENKNTDGTITDPYIWGKIELDETQDDDSKAISYTVNCDNDKSSQKNTYTFTQTKADAKEFTVELKNPGSNAKLADNNQQTVIYKVENGEEYLTRNGKKYTTLLN